MGERTPITFSVLKAINRSPLHYKYARDNAFEPTRAMRIGTIVHHMVLGPRAGRALAVFPGDARRGAKWSEFIQANPGAELVTESEWVEARPVADSLLADDTSRVLIAMGEHEIPMAWHEMDLPCATSGIDVMGPRDPFGGEGGYLADIKTTKDTSPDEFMRHCLNMFYHCQLAWYDKGARSNGHNPANKYIIGVEVNPPYPVTVLKMTPDVLDIANKTLRLWMERLHACEDSNAWPGYAQRPIDWELPAWMQGGDDDD